LSNVTWSTGGKEVKVCSKSESCPLVVGNVSAGQQINYTCSARNSFGFVEDYMTILGEGTQESIFEIISAVYPFLYIVLELNDI